MKVCDLFWIPLAGILAGCAIRPLAPLAPNVTLKLITNEITTAIISAQEILSKRNQFEAQRVQVNEDPFYGSAMNYSAIRLWPVVEQLAAIKAEEIGSREFVFVCADGYRAILRGRDVSEETPFLAFSSAESLMSTNWVSRNKGNELSSPAPLYLVWTNSPQGLRPWPYMITHIEIRVAGQSLNQAMPPRPSEQVRSGFDLFQLNCAGCHAVNGAGGQIGVDLNYPLNVTEYWKESHLKRLISNPGTVRANSRMPAFPHLTIEEVDDIVTYLKAMRRHKKLE